MYSFKNIKVFSGNANHALAKSIADYLDLPLGKARVQRFSDAEISVEVEENVRGMDVFIIQPTCPPTNENLMELLIMIDAMKRSSADRITAVVPYYGYARQDRKVAPRTPISSKLVADLLTAAGTNRLLCMDLHAGQIQGFFNIPVDNLFALPVMLQYLEENLNSDIVVVAPDAGGAERARAYAKRLSAPMALIDKRRIRANEAQAMNVIGDVKGKRAIIVDDIIDTAGTITEAASALLKNGAKEVFACCVHAVLSGPAVERLNSSEIKQLIVSDTIPTEEKQKACPKLKVLTVAPLLGEAIRRIYHADSVSSLFI